MQIWKIISFITTLLFILLQTGCKSDNSSKNNIVATYESTHQVTIEELNTYVRNWLYYKKFKKREDAYKNALNDMLVNQFKRIDFFEKGLDEYENLPNSIIRVINEEMVTEYYETKYLLHYANEENAKQIYEIMDKEVVYRAIHLKEPENISNVQLDSLKETALRIKEEISNGVDFSLLVKKYSQNQISLGNNGYMPNVDWRQAVSSKIGAVLFQLNKGDIEIVETSGELVIVMVIDIKKIKVQPFELIKNEIIEELKKGYAESSLDEFEKDKKEFINEESLNWNIVELKKIKNWFKNPNFFKGEYKKTIQDAIDRGENKDILTYDKGSLDYNRLLHLIDDILIMKYYEDIEETDVKKYLLEALRTEIIVQKANSLGLRKNLFNAFTENYAIKNQIVRIYNLAEIEDKIPAFTDDDLLKFFKENEKSLYYHPEKVNLFVIEFDSEQEAEEASNSIKKGTSFEKVKESYFVKTYIKEPDGEIKSYHSKEQPIFGKKAFSMKESEISSPIKFVDENNEEKYAIVKCYHIASAKQLTFDEAKLSVEEDLKNQFREKIEKEVEEKLKEKYQYEINDEVLNNLISLK